MVFWKPDTAEALVMADQAPPVRFVAVCRDQAQAQAGQATDMFVRATVRHKGGGTVRELLMVAAAPSQRATVMKTGKPPELVYACRQS